MLAGNFPALGHTATDKMGMRDAGVEMELETQLDSGEADETRGLAARRIGTMNTRAETITMELGLSSPTEAEELCCSWMLMSSS